MMVCVKQFTYESVTLARRAVRKFRVRPGKKAPVDVYWCEEHHGWHITSRPQRG